MSNTVSVFIDWPLLWSSWLPVRDLQELIASYDIQVWCAKMVERWHRRPTLPWPATVDTARLLMQLHMDDWFIPWLTHNLQTALASLYPNTRCYVEGYSVDLEDTTRMRQLIKATFKELTITFGVCGPYIDHYSQHLIAFDGFLGELHDNRVHGQFALVNLPTTLPYIAKALIGDYVFI